MNEIVNKSAQQQIERLTSLSTDAMLSTEQQDKVESLLQQQQHSDTPWFVHVLQGFGAWLSAFMFLIVFFLLKVIDSPSELIVSGIILLVIAFVNSIKANDQSSYLSQLLFAASLTGHVLITIGIGAMLDNSNIAAISMMMLAIISILFYQQSAHRFLSVHLLFGTLLVLAHEHAIFDIAFTLLLTITVILAARMWVYESHYVCSPYRAIYRPIQYALISALLIGVTGIKYVTVEFARYSAFDFAVPMYEILALVFFGCFAWLISHILQRLEYRLQSVISASLFAIALLLSIIFYQQPAILAALLILLLGIERNNPLLIPLAIIALVYFLGRYYYLLDLTLLHKSLLLMASGIPLLVAGVISYRRGKQYHA